MQPLATITVTRPWHWGIVVLSDPSLGGQIPDVDPSRSVSANKNGLVVVVRHAQDQVASFDDGFEWAEASVTVRHFSDEPPPGDDRVPMFEGAIDLPTGRLWIGDADGDVQMGGPVGSSTVRVLFPVEEQESPAQIWVDVWQE
jgi:hypothetical protein